MVLSIGVKFFFLEIYMGHPGRLFHLVRKHHVQNIIRIYYYLLVAPDPQILNSDNPGPPGLSRVLSAQRQGYHGAQTTHFSLFWVRVDFRESGKADRCSATN